MRAAALITTLLSLVSDRLETRSEKGATAVEYGLLVGLIAVAIIAVLVILGPQLAGLFTRVSTALNGVPA